MTSASILCSRISLRAACQRRSSSRSEIAVLMRSEIFIVLVAPRSGSGLHAQKAFGITETDIGPHIVAKRYAVDEVPGFLCLLERIVGAEHDALVAECRDRAVERLRGTHPRHRYDEIVAKIFRRSPGELDGIKVGTGAAVEAQQQEWQCLAQMSQAYPGAGKAVEQPAEDEAQCVRAGLECPFPGRAAQPLVAFEHRRRRHRIGRMQIDQRAERLGVLPERRE